MNTKNKFQKSSKSGFIDLILMIVAGLLLMRYYNFTTSDLMDWFQSLSVDKVIGWLKDLVDWCKSMLDSIGKPNSNS